MLMSTVSLRLSLSLNLKKSSTRDKHQEQEVRGSARRLEWSVDCGGELMGWDWEDAPLATRATPSLSSPADWNSLLADFTA